MRNFKLDSDINGDDGSLTKQVNIPLFNRIEKKYLLSPSIAGLLKAQISFYIPCDEKAIQSPFISSIYFDNKVWKCFWDHKNKINPRFKIRFRRYSNRNESNSKGFLEIKSKVYSSTIKDRIKIDYEHLDFVSEHPFSPELQSSNQRIEVNNYEGTYYKILREIKTHQLEPVVNILYRREAFENLERTLRITFDTNLKFKRINGINASSIINPLTLTDQFYVMEVKYSSKLPNWLSSLVKSYELKKQRFSKYCVAMDQLNDPIKQKSNLLYNETINDERKNEYGSTKGFIINPVNI